MAMNSFEWVDATTVEQAAGLLAEATEQSPSFAKAGGIDLLDLMKEGISGAGAAGQSQDDPRPR